MGKDYLMVQVLVVTQDTPFEVVVLVPEAHSPASTDFLVAFVTTIVVVLDPLGSVSVHVHVRSFLQEVANIAIATAADNVIFFIWLVFKVL